MFDVSVASFTEIFSGDAQ